MAAHSFDSILKELSQQMNLSKLESTSNNNISLQIPPNKTLITLEKHKKQPLLIITSDILEMPAGRFRENVLKEALKFNGINEAHRGTFAFSKKSQRLIVFDMLPLDDISPEMVIQVMNNIAERASLWKESLERGDIPTANVETNRVNSGSIFGMRP